MFTGIIEDVGRVKSLELTKDGGRLTVDTSGARSALAPLKVSDSIAVNGCCLTVIECDADSFAADLSGETLQRTALGEKTAGTPVNLERPLTAGARLGGHFVQGHVDTVGRITRLAREGDNWWLSVQIPEEFRRYVAEKGSIAIDGISLTVARWRDGVADIAIIPFTYGHTSILALTVGDSVNVECDILAKYMESLIESGQKSSVSRLTIGELIEQGF